MMLDEQHCAEEAARVYRYVKKWGSSKLWAVFVTPEGVFFAEEAGRRSYANLMAKYGHCVVGYYNRRVDLIDLREDILSAARKMKLG